MKIIYLLLPLLIGCQFPFGADNLDAGSSDADIKDADVKDISSDVVLCSGIDEVCELNSCCEGSICAAYATNPNVKTCRILCTKSSQCPSTCCARLTNSFTNGVCADISMCEE